MHAALEDLKDAIAFALLGFRGPWERWVINRVVEVWCRPLGGPE